MFIFTFPCLFQFFKISYKKKIETKTEISMEQYVSQLDFSECKNGQYWYNTHAKSSVWPKNNRRCRLMVIEASHPRTRSTLSMKLLRSYLWQALYHSIDFTVIDYWNICKHTENGMCSVVRADGIILTKTHEYVPELYDVCENTLVVQVNRSFGETMASIKRLGWGNEIIWKDWMHQQHCWAKSSGENYLHITANTLLTNSSLLYDLINHKINKIVPLNTTSVLKKWVLYLWKKELHREANEQIKSTLNKIFKNPI